MKFNRRSAEGWDVIDEADNKLGTVKVDGGVSCFQQVENCGALIVEELREIAEFAETLTLRPASV